MTAAIVGTPTIYVGGNADTHAVPRVDDAVSGNKLLLFVQAIRSPGISGTVTWVPPAGWDLEAEKVDFHFVTQLYSRTAGAAEPATYDFHTDTGDNRRLIAYLVALETYDLNQPIEDIATGGLTASTEPVCPALDTLVSDTLNFVFYGALGGESLVTVDGQYPSGYTGIANRLSTGAGTDTAAGLAHKTQASAGNEPAATWSGNFSANQEWHSISVAIRPSGGGEPPPPGTPELRQTAYRGFNDDAAPASSTGKAAVDTPWEQAADETFCVRVVVAEAAGEALAGASFKWQARRNGAAWFDVTTSSSIVKAVASANFADGGDATQRIHSTEVTFIADNNGLDETGAFGPVSFAGSDEMESHLAAQLVGADVSPGDTINLRVVEADGTLLSAYLQTPAIIVEGQVVAANWFIDSVSGSDAFDGQSIATAVKTIAELKTRALMAGDTVSWARSGVWRERFDFNVQLNHVAHGTGAKPKITGADSIKGTTGVWAEVDTNVWRRNFTPENTPPTVCLFDGAFDFDPEPNLAGVDAPHKWFWDNAALTIAVFSTSNPALAFTSLELGSRSTVAPIDNDGNSVTDLHFTAGRNAAIVRGDGNTFLRCQFDLSGRDGVQVRGTARLNVFDACQIVDNGQYVDALPGSQQQQGDHGIKFYDQSSENTIRNSTIARNGEDNVQVQSSAAGTVLTLEDNTLTDSGEGPLDIKDGDVVCRRNYLECDNEDQTVVTLHNAQFTFTSEGNRYIDLTGGAPALQVTDGSAIVNSKRDIFKGRVNLANPRGACSFENGLVFWGDLASGPDYLMRIDSKTGHVLNGMTLVADGGDRAFRLGASSPGVTIRNSILQNTGVELIERQSGTLVLEHNLYDTDNVTYYDNGGDLQDATEIIANHDPNGAVGDPLFVNVAAENYRLQSGSPAIGLADPATAPETDLELRTRGASPDAGAFQFAAAAAVAGTAAILLGL